MALRTCPRCEASYIATVSMCVDCKLPLEDLDEHGGRAPAGEVPEPVGGPIDLQADDNVGYGLDDWTDEQQAELSATLVAERIPYVWEGGELVVRDHHADLVEELIDDLDHPDALDADDDDGDDSGAQLLSDLYVASDMLVGDPDHRVAVTEVLQLSGSMAGTSPPFGVERATWATVAERLDHLADLLGDDAPEEEIVPVARSIRDALRPLV
jgi:hypothetical protein